MRVRGRIRFIVRLDDDRIVFAVWYNPRTGLVGVGGPLRFIEEALGLVFPQAREADIERMVKRSARRFRAIALVTQDELAGIMQRIAKARGIVEAVRSFRRLVH